MNFFNKYKIKETVKHLLVAEEKINTTNDHRTGVRYLNSKLDKKQRIRNFLQIPNIFKKINTFLRIQTHDIYLELAGYSKESYDTLTHDAFDILLPALIKEDSIGIWPDSFNELYLEAKNK